MNHDISPILEGWDFDPGAVTVRKIKGLDGRTKIQMRLELGLLQMETEGRPDGTRPFRKESLLEYYTDLLEEHKHFFGNEEGFELDAEACANLRQEALTYYYRYLALFHLNEYAGVVRDTSRNLRVFDLIWQYSTDENDRWILEQYRPYVIMMNTRSNAMIHIQKNDFEQALRQVEEGIHQIEDYFTRHEREELTEECRELSFLKDWLEEIRSRKPLTERDRLKLALVDAVEREDYERAAVLRDAIRKLH